MSGSSKNTRSKRKVGVDTGDASQRTHNTSGGLTVLVTDIQEVREDSNKTLPGRSCKTCGGPDTNDMVQCDDCDKWHHFACVGVDKEIEQHEWSCPKCIAAATRVQKQGFVSNKTSSVGRDSSVSKEHSRKSSSLVGSKLFNKSASSKQSVALSEMSHASSRHSMLNLELQKLEEEHALAQQEAERQRTYLEKKYSILKQMSHHDGSNPSEGNSQVDDWIEDVNNVDSHNSTSNKSDRSFGPKLHSTNNLPQPCPLGFQNKTSSASYGASDFNRNTTRKHSLPSRCSRPPTREQIAARQAVSKDLPQFSGDPEDWPLFLSTFNSTTAMCGFTDEENTIRLQRCLKGRAYDAVKSCLMHPSNVKSVLATLRMLFGQPEAVVNSLVSKINLLPMMEENSLETIVDFAINIKNFCAIVDACGLEEYLYNVSLLHQLVSKLSPTIRLDWARYRQTLPSVNLASFGNWIYSLAEAASTVTILPIIQAPKLTKIEPLGTKKRSAFTNVHAETQHDLVSSSQPKNLTFVKPPAIDICLICKGTCRTAEKCKQFLDLSRDSRWAVVREFGLCRRCLHQHSGGCKTKPCGKNGCEFKHHALLHNDQKDAVATENQSKSTSSASLSQSEPSNGPRSCNAHAIDGAGVFFRYLPVILHGNNRSVATYAFFDDGSELTLLDQELADELSLEGDVQPLCLRWTGGAQRNENKSRIVNLEVAGIRRNSKKFRLNTVRTVDKLLLPLQTLDFERLAKTYPHLRGLPIASYCDAQPRILIGMKHAGINVVQKTREMGIDDPIAVKTRLGWTICGSWLKERTTESSLCTLHVQESDLDEGTDESLHLAMKAYFALESLGLAKTEITPLSSGDQRAQYLLQSLTNFQGDRYETGLLWRYENIRLPDSRPLALRRYNFLQKRLEKDALLAQILNEKIVDYLSKGYARKLTSEELNNVYPRVWYLPIFPVSNPNKPGKTRIVWDAAAKAFGVSLNSVLLKGPDQLCSLLTILLQFRERRVAMTADIREMFHQIRVREEDQQCQRFLWQDENGEIATYVMQVMTFGACCSPCCAQFTKNLNAARFSNSYPAAVESITKRHYVDDLLVSVDTEKEAIQLAHDIWYVHSKGGFEIRNWLSNSKTVLSQLRDNPSNEKNLDLQYEMATEKVLGMWWHTASDIFIYKVGWARFDHSLLSGQRRPTKREALRVLMTIFDPLGLIAHFLMYLKILLQEVWRSGVQWDEDINDEAFHKWLKWIKVLPQVENVQVPRCYSLDSSPGDSDDTQLHTLVDASENGMAAVCYLRFVHDNIVRCSIVVAKTRVAPLKFVSIPKLELQAAVIGARLARTVGESLSIPISKRVFWTDSRDVLCWINSDHRRYTQFVAFRVGEILENCETNEWRWVPTKQNVADDGTKWEKLPDFTSNNRWFVGPAFLRRPEAEWPKQSSNYGSTETELRPHLCHHRKVSETLIRVTDFSSWKRLVNLRQQQIYIGPFSMEELRTAERYLIRQAQFDVYPEEVTALSLMKHEPPAIKNTLSKSSPLYKLTPSLDVHGILRMRTRIAACHFATDDAKSPIILPRDHHLTTLIIEYFHNKYHHQNHETVINELRQKYHVSRIRVEYGKVRRNCQRCKNESTTPHPPVMADLPEARLAAFTRPFTHIGIDCFGPMEVVLGRRVEKRWGMLIICLTTRAIHIEVVHSLSTNSCILALRNFVARRGTPRKIYSDRGTNFIGASRELKEAESLLDRQPRIWEEAGKG
ncbi:uncharacterized protein LOC131429200 [Malaya genurostris]|uniref:uncharacterized protein LOC131429200 n=1 Tax=Malaya genurostris TaxID=325434 RepID=UPI0026F40922|nr:uncharacterized protein LOC131429200 [Malaya genurostris]